MDWQQLREILNWSTPLAGLIIAGWLIHRVAVWFATRFIEPLGGPEGIIARYVREQETQLARATQQLKTLVQDISHSEKRFETLQDSIDDLHRNLQAILELLDDKVGHPKKEK